MFEGLKRGFVFGKIAGALESFANGSGDGKVLGWDMQTWKAWLEGALITIGGAVAGALADSVQSGQAFSAQSFKATALAAGLAALAAYLRRNPSDPRRDKPEEPKG